MHGASSQVGFDDGRVAHDVLRRALGDHLSEIQHQHALRQPHHHFQHVFDDDQRDPRRVDAAQDLGQRDGLGRIQAAGDLVQQQHARLGGQRPRQLHALLAGHVQLGGPDAGAVRQPHQLQHLHRFAARVRQPGMTQQGAHHGVLQHRHLAEAARDLISPHQPHRRHLLGALADHGLAVEHHRARGGLVVADQAIEQGALARAIRPDDGDDLAGLHRQRDVLVGHQAAEALGQILNVQQSHGASSR